jgi:hypothetical protein
MPDPGDKAAIDQQFRILQIIHLAMLLSLGAYVIVGFVLRPARAALGGSELSGLLVQLFYGVSAAIVLAVFFLRKRLLQPLKPGLTSAREIESWGAKFRAGHIVIYALSEAIGIFGLVSLFIAGSQAHFLNLILLSFALLIFLRPKRIDPINS